MTGTRLLSFPDALTTIATACGRNLSYLSVSGAECGAGLIAAGLPEDLARQLVALLHHVLDGHNASIADEVRQVLGRDLLDFTEYALRAAAGAFNPAPAPSHRR